jgi:hypothetical protein
VVLIQEPSVKKEDQWKAKICDGNYIYVHSNSDDRLYILTAIRKYMEWNHYGESRNADKVGIKIEQLRIINIYYHRNTQWI